MNLRICMAKLHKVKVTEANPGYRGSITIGTDLLEASGIKPWQMVIINNGENGHTWQTYVMPGKKGEVCLNGRPPAHHFTKGDEVIILAEAYITPEEWKNFEHRVVLVEEKSNDITEILTYKRGELIDTKKLTSK